MNLDACTAPPNHENLQKHSKVCKIKGSTLCAKRTSHSPTSAPKFTFLVQNMLPNHPQITPKFSLRFGQVLGHIVGQSGVAFCPRFGPGRTYLAPKGLPSGPKRYQEAPRDCHGRHHGSPRALQGIPQCHFGLILVGGSLVVPRTSP